VRQSSIIVGDALTRLAGIEPESAELWASTPTGNREPVSNPARAIHLTGEVVQVAEHRLTPKMLRVQSRPSWFNSGPRLLCRGADRRTNLATLCRFTRSAPACHGAANYGGAA